MAPPLTFGLELEFLLGFIPPECTSTSSLPAYDFSPASDRITGQKARTTTFPLTLKLWNVVKAYSLGLSTELDEVFHIHTAESRILRDALLLPSFRLQMRHNFASHNLPFSCKADGNDGGFDLSTWHVGRDPSINTFGEPPDSITTRMTDVEKGCHWFPIEIVSPALPLNSASLQQVSTMCEVLNTEYLTYVSKTCGLHVHLSFGAGANDPKWTISSVYKLIQFLWAFSPQISTLHPPHRVGNLYCKSLRQTSQFSLDFFSQFGVWPTPGHGLVLLSKIKPDSGDEPRDKFRKGAFEVLLSQTAGPPENRQMVYNFHNLWILERERRVGTPAHYDEDGGLMGTSGTVEFRQHEGCLEMERVTMWIRTLGGIINFLEDVDQVNLYELLLVCVKHEHWEKKMDGADAANEARYGPILAESGFTIIDLLKHIGLHEEASFYSQPGRAFKPQGEDNYKEDDGVLWPYRKVYNDIMRMTTDMENSEFDLKEKRREIWYKMRVAKSLDDSITFDPESEFWPEHTYVARP